MTVLYILMHSGSSYLGPSLMSLLVCFTSGSCCKPIFHGSLLFFVLLCDTVGLTKAFWVWHCLLEPGWHSGGKQLNNFSHPQEPLITCSSAVMTYLGLMSPFPSWLTARGPFSYRSSVSTQSCGGIMIAVVVSYLQSSMSQPFCLPCGSDILLLPLLQCSLMWDDISVLIRAKQSTVTFSQYLEKS